MRYEKICLAQNKPSRGNIDKNIENHITLISKAIEEDADLIIFPELSLTSYEPSRIKNLAINIDDERLDYFQVISNKHSITIIISAPITTPKGVNISLLIFNPMMKLNSYSKQYLHEDELPYFVNGVDDNNILGEDPKLALAICYETSIPDHQNAAIKNGATIYLSSVAKSKEGVIKGQQQLSNVAKTHAITTMMSNSVGLCEDYECMGSSAIWDKEGSLMDQLDNYNEGILIYDCTKDEICFKWQSIGPKNLNLANA